MKYKNTSRLDVVFDIFNYGFMIMLAILFVYPFWQTLVLSVSSPRLAMSMGLKLIPDGFYVKSYQEVFSSGIIYTSYFNTLVRTVLGTLLTITITYCGAYALSKKNLPFRNPIMMLILFTMFFSGGMIPSYLLIVQLGMFDKLWALILPAATSAWNLIIARNFIASLPESLEEAAHVDGAHPITIAFKIMLPLSLPIIAVLTLWSAVWHWNAWFDAMIYTRDSKNMVLQLLLRQIIISTSNQFIGSGDILTVTTAETTPETVKAATIIITIAPIICTYPFLQRYFVKGIMVGAVKG